MSTHSQSRREQSQRFLKLTSGTDLLDAWAQSAAQSHKNIVSELLFSVVEKSVFSRYEVVDAGNPLEFFVLPKANLAVKIRMHDFESFGIVYIGQTCSAPGSGSPWSDTEKTSYNSPEASETQQW
ncbi:MAG TPA: DUF6235 family protein [Streptosporangiaceae bacterium]